MKIGFIGLGKMGSNMVKRLLRSGHEVVTYDSNISGNKIGANCETTKANSTTELVKNLPLSRIVWLMVSEGNPV